MCRYAFHEYRRHLVCLSCRRGVKRRYERGDRCPQCGAAMIDVGLDHAVPPRRATAQWRKLELLLGAGIGFHSCGCGGPGYRPHTLAETKRFVAARRAQRDTLLRPCVP